MKNKLLLTLILSSSSLFLSGVANAAPDIQIISSPPSSSLPDFQRFMIAWVSQ